MFAAGPPFVYCLVMPTPPTVTAADLAPRLPLDATIAALCDGACVWLFSLACQSFMLGVTLAAALTSMLPRLHTGYMGKAARNDRDHGLYTVGAKTPAPRVPAAQARVNREFAILYAVAS